MLKISTNTTQIAINKYTRPVSDKINHTYCVVREKFQSTSKKKTSNSILTKYVTFKEKLARKSKPINQKILQEAGIPNYEPISQNGARGEALSSRKNRRFLKTIKQAGIDTVIDLRNQYASESYPSLCKKNKLKYYNIPIDSSGIDDREIIKNLPLLFKLLTNSNYYIACAQGLHRTDIALSINYLFNPKAKEVPFLKGHIRNGKLKSDDIIRRINSIKRELTEKEIKKLGWKNDFEEAFQQRKNNLISYNAGFINN